MVGHAELVHQRIGSLEVQQRFVPITTERTDECTDSVQSGDRDRLELRRLGDQCVQLIDRACEVAEQEPGSDLGAVGDDAERRASSLPGMCGNGSPGESWSNRDRPSATNWSASAGPVDHHTPCAQTSRLIAAPLAFERWLWISSNARVFRPISRLAHPPEARSQHRRPST